MVHRCRSSRRHPSVWGKKNNKELSVRKKRESWLMDIKNLRSWLFLECSQVLLLMLQVLWCFCCRNVSNSSNTPVQNVPGFVILLYSERYQFSIFLVPGTLPALQDSCPWNTPGPGNLLFLEQALALDRLVSGMLLAPVL